MTTWQRRLTKEHQSLLRKIARLEGFMSTVLYTKLSIQEQVQLDLQLDAMTEYHLCLMRRINYYKENQS